MEIWEPKTPGTLWATPGLLWGSFTLPQYTKKQGQSLLRLMGTTIHPLPPPSIIPRYKTYDIIKVHCVTK
jgi:hypothetical protein